MGKMITLGNLSCKEKSYNRLVRFQKKVEKLNSAEIVALLIEQETGTSFLTVSDKELKSGMKNLNLHIKSLQYRLSRLNEHFKSQLSNNEEEI